MFGSILAERDMVSLVGLRAGIIHVAAAPRIVMGYSDTMGPTTRTVRTAARACTLAYGRQSTPVCSIAATRMACVGRWEVARLQRTQSWPHQLRIGCRDGLKALDVAAGAHPALPAAPGGINTHVGA
jgi:hypothetical protein